MSHRPLQPHPLVQSAPRSAPCQRTPLLYAPTAQSTRPPPFIDNPSRPPFPKRNPEYCILYNKHDGLCPYGMSCTKAHMCAYCNTSGHPVAQCPNKPNY